MPKASEMHNDEDNNGLRPPSVNDPVKSRPHSVHTTSGTAPQANQEELADRDPYGMNHHLRLTFEDVIAEPDPDAYSIDKVWSLSNRSFTGSKRCCYRFLTLLCALPISCCLGLNLAGLSFTYIWCAVPIFKAVGVVLALVRDLFSLIVKAFIEPFCLAQALLFSRVNVHGAYRQVPQEEV